MRKTANKKRQRRIYMRDYMRRYRKTHMFVSVPRKKVERRQANVNK